MSAKIRELPSPRWIMFYDEELPFIPFDRQLWLAQSDVRSALAEPQTPMTSWCLDFPHDLEHINAREHAWFYKLEFARHSIKAETYFPIKSIRYFIHIAGYRADQNGLHRRIDRFESLLDELDGQSQKVPLVHSHVCGEEADILRSVLNKHPHWEQVLELWNCGKTESVIAEVLQIKITKVRSAVQHLRKHGFDLLSAELRDYNAASNGRAHPVPKVRMSDLERSDTLSVTDKTTAFHHDP